MVYDAHVQHAVVRHGVRRLSVAGRVADAHRHDVALDVVMIDLYVHAIFQTLENHQYEGEHKRQRTRSEIVAGLTTEVHYGSYQSDVDAVEEVAAASLTLLIGISYASEVNLAHMTLLQPLDGLAVVALAESPEMGEVVHQSVGNNAEHDTLTHTRIVLHQAVHGIVKRRVASYDNNRFVAVVDHHLYKTVHTGTALTLYEVVFHAIVLQTFLYLLPTTLRTQQFMLRAVKHAPSFVVWHKDL